MTLYAKMTKYLTLNWHVYIQLYVDITFAVLQQFISSKIHEE
jgi:hypothetical protein